MKQRIAEWLREFLGTADIYDQQIRSDAVFQQEYQGILSRLARLETLIVERPTVREVSGVRISPTDWDGLQSQALQEFERDPKKEN